MEKRCFGCMQLKEGHPICEHCGFDERTKNLDHQLPVGTVLGGQYTIGKALGQGGFGITYLAWDHIMNQPVAVKEYFPKGFASRTVGNLKVTSYDGQNARDFELNKKRFLREAESMAKLWDIPQIVKILRLFEENGTAYIVMEYVRGANLRDHIKRLGRPLTMDETLFLLGPVVEGLRLVHKINLVHRDIAPDNIMILPNGSAKLLDFGAARYVENADAEKERPSSTQQVLKHGFAPPEQYSSHGALGPWTDVYALCGTIYYCLTGKVPPDALDRGYGGAVISWDHIPGLTPKQKSALEKGMALQPRERFSTVEELWKQLKPVVPKPKPTPKPTPRPKSEPPKKQWKKPIGIVAAILAVVVGAVAFQDRGERQTPDLPIETIGVQVQETGATENIPHTSQVIFTYEENDTGWTVTGFEGSRNGLPRNMILPEIHNDRPVTSIGDSAFRGCDKLTRVTIPDSVTSIGDSAFRSCNNLGGVMIPDSVISVGNSAFSNCSSLTSVTIPDSVTSIGDSAFQGCSVLRSVTIPDSVASIGDSAFRGCYSLTSVTIPDSVTSIGNMAFYECSRLTSVTIPESATSIGNLTFYGCSSLSNVSIPDSVTSIGNSAFSNCSSLSSVTIPDSVTSIGDSAFRSCDKLSSVTIPDSVTSIGEEAFFYCRRLRSVTISKDCFVGDGAFPETCTVYRR